MRCEDLWITGTGSVLGDLVPVAEAVADGRYAPADAAEAGLVSVSHCEEPAPELAVRAGRAALRASGEAAPRIALHLHGACWFQGLDMWSAACRVADEVLGGAPLPGLSVQVSALSNGSLACLELAAGLLAGRPDVPAALVTAADRFHPAGLDRWNFDSGVVLGDGAGAAVLTRGTGPGSVEPGAAGARLRLLSCASWSDPGLEGLQRGTTPPSDRPGADPRPLVVRERARQFFSLGPHTPASVLHRHVEGVHRVVTTALRDAGSTVDDLRWVVTPFVGQAVFRAGYADVLGLDHRRTLHEFGRRVGHLGSADQLVGLDHLVRGGELRPGDRICLIGVGAGFTFSAAVLEAA
ncbi:ketoacyl-ACP synthase III family protein [Streptomyces sp. ACA25]|uniref:ketoacyl-ACP synthase III family protein n=1 Tax=Streptomyces sp. ACA25 TaxID=3022596 RepID=UPI002306E544|nr:ketoacyl-ACP synthase III family protein [Streptomyces sp. ACA25]MDB1087487.1 ketoacyl-ACP synthase III family protein [Streptomyces sp. ACA25]